MERNKSVLYKAKDVVEGKDPKNQVFILKWRNGRTCMYTVKARKCLFNTKIGIRKLQGTHKTRNRNSTMKMKTLRVVITKPEELD
jgi:hypothetical protein